MSDGETALERLVSSDIKADILVLFHRNPGLVDNIEGVARRIGRRAGMIEKDLNDLLDLGVLKRKQVGKHEAILLDRGKNKQMQDAVEDEIRQIKGN